MIHGARTLHCFLFGLNTLLFYCLVSNNFRSNDLWALSTALLFCMTPGMFSLHYMAWSESPFLAFMLIHLLFLRSWLTTGRSYMLVLSALAISLALLTRYAGVAFIGAACLVIVFPIWKLQRENSTDICLRFDCCITFSDLSGGKIDIVRHQQHTQAISCTSYRARTCNENTRGGLRLV